MRLRSQEDNWLQFHRDLLSSFSKFAVQMSKVNQIDKDHHYEWISKLTKE